MGQAIAAHAAPSTTKNSSTLLGCHRNGGHHVWMNGTMVFVRSWRREYRHKRRILFEGARCGERIRITGDRMESITGIGPNDFCPRLDC